ncbi:unnamed protein product, partial [Prorocentrum cordatum]
PLSLGPLLGQLEFRLKIPSEGTGSQLHFRGVVMLSEPLRGDHNAWSLFPTNTQDPVWRILRLAAPALRHWWRLTTDTHYLASPTSRRVFWRLYWISLVCWLALWLCLIFAGVVEFNIVGQTVTEALVMLLLLSLAMTTLTTTSLWSDFFISSVYCGIFLFVCKRHPLLGVVTQLPLYCMAFWAFGLHSCVIAQFSISGVICCCVYVPSVDVVIKVQALVVLFPILLLEWQSVSHFSKIQKVLNVSTDGQVIINRYTGIVVSMSDNMSDLLSGSAVGTQFNHFVHRSACSQADQRLCKSRGDPSETFMVTLNCVPNGIPTQEFEARIIPYEVTGPLLHFCLQVVGEKRFCHQYSAEQPPMNKLGSSPSSPPGSATPCDVEQAPMITSSAILAQIECHAAQESIAAPVAHEGHPGHKGGNLGDGHQSRRGRDEAASRAERRGHGQLVRHESRQRSAAHRRHQSDGETSGQLGDSDSSSRAETFSTTPPGMVDPSAAEKGTEERQGRRPPRGRPGAAAAAAPRPGGERALAGRALGTHSRGARAGQPPGAAPPPAVGAPGSVSVPGRPNQLMLVRSAWAGGPRAPRTRPQPASAGGAGPPERQLGLARAPGVSGAPCAQAPHRSGAPAERGAAAGSAGPRVAYFWV